MADQEDTGVPAGIADAGAGMPFVQRLEAFAAEYCRKQPSLGMVGAMAWVLGVDFEFRLRPRNETTPGDHP